MEYRLLNSFLALAEMLHFGRAAKFLNLTQPALSNQIAALERELGGALFVRTARGIFLTEAGRLLQSEGRKLLKDTNDLSARVSAFFRGSEGTIRIGYGDVTELKRLSRPLLLLKERHPSVEVQVSELYPGETMESVQSGSLDAALITGRENMEFPQGLRAIPIMMGPIKLAMPAGHPLAKLKEIRREDLIREPFIKRKFGETDETSEMVKLLEDWWEKFFGGEANVLMSVRRRSTAFWLVSSGVGVALLPNCMELFACSPAEYSFYSNVEFRYLPGLNIMSYTWFVYREQTTPALANFIDCIDSSLEIPESVRRELREYAGLPRVVENPGS